MLNALKAARQVGAFNKNYMHKTCNGCRALRNETGSRGNKICELGFGNKCTKEIMGIPVDFVPTELCPKPKTIDAYLQEMQLLGKREMREAKKLNNNNNG